MKTAKIIFATVILLLTISCTKTNFVKNDVAMVEQKTQRVTVSSLPEMDALEAY